MHFLFPLLLTILLIVSCVTAVTYQELLDKATYMKNNDTARYQCAIKNMLLSKNKDALGAERIQNGSPERMIAIMEGQDGDDIMNQRIYDYLVQAEGFDDFAVYRCTREHIFARE